MQTVDAQVSRRRTRIRPNPVVQQQREELVEQQDNEEQAEYADEDSTAGPALQYYQAAAAQPNEGQGRVVIVSSDDEYNGLYGRPTSGPRARADYNRPIAKSSSAIPRTKESTTKETVQTLRNYSKVNDDGSFTFGYEAADGSFKEETRGTDCVVRGKYGYVDPDGNKREFTYVSGNPCDPNNPDPSEDELDKAEDDTNEPENVPANFPRRPLRPVPRPIQTTTHAPTTVFQNQYASNSYNGEEEEADENAEQERLEPIQLLQQRPRVSARPQHLPAPEEVAIRQRPRITVNTTPTPLYQLQTQSGNSVSITPRPTYRIPVQTVQTQPPATTYRPAIQFFTQKTAPVAYSKPQSHLSVEPITKTAYASTRKPIDFAAELQNFQRDYQATSTTPRSHLKTYRPLTAPEVQSPPATPNPIYETQLVFDPSTGQSLFPHINEVPQQQLNNNRIQPAFVPQQAFHASPQIVTLEQLQQQNALHQQQQNTLQQQQNAQPLYQRAHQQSTQRAPLQFPQFNQQIYHKDHENLQVLNSQQLYAQQQELQQKQLHQDRIEAAKRIQNTPQQQNHRFQLGQQPNAQQQQQQEPGFYFVQQPQASPLQTYF